ncbi:hypothetical protein GGR54DRAFT_639639 [Hypoxylon sp. NC1633]|nr:hypothetical protein GGR54DRAFT_639639 [Hypoxylon sp. NC1633]
MLFPESDASLLKAWITQRLANTSDADADVLADYVLALLRHDGDVESIRRLFEEEIPDFLREDATAFTNDVFHAIKFRSYLPGALPAPPPPPTFRQTLPPPPAHTNVPLLPRYQPPIPFAAPPTAAPFAQSRSRKRAYNDLDDNDVDIILTGQGLPPSVPHPYKQSRRGAGFSQRGGRSDDLYGTRDHRGFPNSYGMTSSSGHFVASPPFQPPQRGQGMPSIGPDSILGGLQSLQQLGIPLPEMSGLPEPVYSGSIPTPHRKKQRCRVYEMRGYCPRGNNCKFEHVAKPAMPPQLGPLPNDEYDPNNAIFMPLMNGQTQPPRSKPLDIPHFPMTSPSNRREPNKPRRGKGRLPFTSNGPVHDRTKTTIVVQNIPNDHFSEEEVRTYFGQFGNISDVSMQESDRLALVNFDTWDAANAAWSSPKVIFDNRFVKVYWYKEDSEIRPSPVNGKIANGVKNDFANGNTPSGEDVDMEPFDMDEFTRKQEEAQKAHDERAKKRQEIERQRQEIEERQKELRARQLEEKRKLQAKLTEKSPMGTSSQMAEGASKQPASQTEALRAQLAALQEEANVLGIDADNVQDDSSSWTTRGRGRGSRGYRAGGWYTPRAARASYGYRGRGGIQARHEAYAAYSLDNRPKVVALSGADFTNPEKDEALRQYLFGIGEFKDIHADLSTTHVAFKDRKTAEQFMFGISANNAIPGLDDKIETTWAASVPRSESQPTTVADIPMTGGIESGQAPGEKTSTEGCSVMVGLEEGEVENERGRDQHDMDYEAGEDWGIA